jgi:hypothetical protein
LHACLIFGINVSFLLFFYCIVVTGQVVKHGAVTCVGYTNIESRMASTASSLFGGNVTNFLLSMEDKKAKKWVINLEDPAVRSICVAIDGKALEPYVPPPAPAAEAKKPDAKKDAKKAGPIMDPEEAKKDYTRKALFATAGPSTALGLAALVPNAPMMSTFALSCWVGTYIRQ